MADIAASRLAFTKLVVDDLDAAERFYAEAFGLRRTRRTPPGEPVFGKEEIVMAPPGAEPGSGTLILTRFAERPCPPPGCAFLGFVVVDAATTLAAATRAGGRVLFSVGPEEAEGKRAGLLKDPAGHLVEFIEVAADDGRSSGGREIDTGGGRAMVEESAMSNRDVIEAFFAALPTGRLPDALVADDMIAWTPTSGDTGKARFAGGIAALAALFAGNFAYRIERLVEDGDRLAAEVRSHGTFTDGELYEQTHMFCFDLAGRRIVRVAEHMNTLVTIEKIVPRIEALMAGR